MSVRERPVSVPEGARWREEDDRWELAPTSSGKNHGPGKWFRKDGTLECELVWDSGVEEGPYARFHENGERSQWGTMKNGRRDGICSWQRSTRTTTERTIPDEMNARVWRSEQEFFEDETCSLARYFDIGGHEVGAGGEPVPPRPDGVPPFADPIQVFPDFAIPMQLGFAGQDARSFKVLVWEHGRMKPGTGTRVGTWRFYWSDGRLFEEIRYGILGTETRTRRLFDPAGRVRVEGAYAFAGDRFPGGGRTPGRPTGMWRFFDASGELVAEKDMSLHDFGGVQAAAMDEALLAFAKVRAYDVPDGAGYCATSDCFRIEEHDLARAFATYEDGTRKAEGCVRIDPNADKRKPFPVGPWRFFDRRGGLIAEIDPSASEWKRCAKLDELHTIHCYVAARNLPKADVDELVEPIPWEKLEWCWSSIAEHARFLIRALVAEDRTLRRTAWGALADHTYHQGTIYSSSAALTPVLLDVIEQPGASATDHLRLLSWYAESLMEEASYNGMDSESLASCDEAFPWSVPADEAGDADASEDAWPPGWLVFMIRAFRDRAALFARLITHPEEETRRLARKIVASGVVGAPKTITTALGGALERSTDPIETAALVTALRPLAKGAGELFRRYYEDAAAAPIVRYAAALVAVEVVMLTDEAPPPPAVATLIALVREAPAALGAAYVDIPALVREGPFEANAAVTLASTVARHEVAPDLVPLLLTSLAKARVSAAVLLASALLRLTQPRTSQDAHREDVIALRRRVLEAIVALEGDVWTWVNFRDVLSQYGLPTALDVDGAKTSLAAFGRRERPFALED